jgi:hypothetical protein
LSAAANGSCEADLCREHPDLVVTHAASTVAAALTPFALITGWMLIG